MSSISGIPITTGSIIKCYQKYYPESYNKLGDEFLFHYLHLWAIRLNIYEYKANQEDFIGILRLNNFGFPEIIYSEGVTEPFTNWSVANVEPNTKRLGGIPYLKEGQYIYNYDWKMGNYNSELPVFSPISNSKVYRWDITENDKKDLRDNTVPVSVELDNALNKGLIKSSKTNSDENSFMVLGNKNTEYGNDKAYQFLYNRDILNKIANCAEEHIEKGYGNIFMYTIFTKEQFLIANGFKVPSDKKTAIDYIIKSGNYRLDRKQLEKMDEQFLLAWAAKVLDGWSQFTFNGKKYNTFGGTRIRERF